MTGPTPATRSRGRAALTGICWAATTATLYRGVLGTKHVAGSLAWLARRQPGPVASPAAGPMPRFILLLPALREQRLLADTTAYLLDLARSNPDVAVSVALVTTERESAERAAATMRLPELARLLARRPPAGKVLGRFLGVLPRDRLEQLAAQAADLGDATACLAATEAAFAELPSTNELAARLVADAQAQGGAVRHYHYPHTDGTMAHQVNFAARAELDRLTNHEGADLADCWLAVYNADSRPDPATLAEAVRTIARLAGAPGGRPRVMQQPALFTGNLDRLGSGASGALLRGAALAQSRWTLAHEVPILRRQSRRARTAASSADGRGGAVWRRWRRWPRLGHCTGHGLFIRGDEFLRWGGLPTEPMNEDLALGLLLSAAGVPIDPLPVPELADSPETVGHLLRQKRQWFWSYIEYSRFSRMAAQARLATPAVRACLVAEGLARGLAWLATSPAVAATLALPFAARRCRRPLAALATVAALAAYIGGPSHLLCRELHRSGRRQRGLTLAELGGGVAAVLTHSIGPWWCVASALRRRLTGARYIHAKTER